MARRKRRKSGSSAALVVATILLFIVSASIIVGYFLLRREADSQVALDVSSLCPVNGPRAVTAILLDVTDPISEATTSDLRNEFQGLVDEIAIGGLLQVYSLTEVEGDLSLTFSGCNPGDGRTADEWTSNPRFVQERWERGFQKPLEEVSQKLSEGGSGAQSPIMAGIQRINLDAFGSPKYRDLPKTLIIASDMIEHTAYFSMYRDGTSYSKFEGSDARTKFRTPLDGVEVRILEFQRPNLRFSDEDLADFWASWVGNNKGRLASFKRMQGVM